MVGSAGATGPSSHTLPIPTGDLTLSGSTVDTTVATLRAVSTSGSPASPGATVGIHYEAVDASGSLGSIVLSFRDAFQIERVITAPKTLPLALVGTVEEVIPTSWPDGEYRLSSIALTDAHNNYAAFYSDGRVVLGRNGEDGPTSHSVDFTPATFTVSGSTADFTPPLAARKPSATPLVPMRDSTT